MAPISEDEEARGNDDITPSSLPRLRRKAVRPPQRKEESVK
jgi:hypothetical protein